MPTTPKFTLPYPAASDPADVPSDMNKLATRIDTIGGAASGLATLDGTTKVPLAQLPVGIVPNLIGTYLARPAANSVGAGTVYYANETLGAWRSDGTNWVLVAQGEALIAPGALDSPPFNTPYDGQRIRFYPDQTAGIGWGFRYRSAATGYKWEFTGGANQTTIIVTSEYRPAGGFGDLQTAGPRLLVNRAGEYEVSGFITVTKGAVAGAFTAISHFFLETQGAAVGQDTTVAGVGSASGATTTRVEIDAVPVQALANEYIRMHYASSLLTADLSYYNRRMIVRPIRVS